MQELHNTQRININKLMLKREFTTVDIYYYPVYVHLLKMFQYFLSTVSLVVINSAVVCK
jgi:hypothetical protein